MVIRLINISSGVKKKMSFMLYKFSVLHDFWKLALYKLVNVVIFYRNPREKL